MNRACDGDEEEECFYESLDRIALSLETTSSCSSPASISDDDDEYNHCIGFTDSAFPVPKFPMGVSNYDIWISEPSSIKERRTRLLREMGLSKDSSLSRVKPVFSFESCDYREMDVNGDFGKSVCSDQLNSQQPLADNSGNCFGIVRSNSDGSTDRCNSSYECRLKNCQHNSQPVCSPSLLSIQSSVLDVDNAHVNNNLNHNHNLKKLVVKSRSGEINGSPVSNGTRPPTGKNRKKSTDFHSDFSCLCINRNCKSMPVLTNNGVGESDDGLDCNGAHKADPQCTIKNLDTGKEFIVNEIKEDGMRNKFKEVGTDKQLTMEEFELCVGHSPIVQELMRRQNVKQCSNRDSPDLNENRENGIGSNGKKKSSWFKSFKNVASNVTGSRERKSSDERETSSEKGGRRSSSATDDSQDTIFHGPERVRVRQYGKSCKELTALYKNQEIQAHDGSLWCIKFSIDGRYLASAGEDCVIHIWHVVESARKGDLLMENIEDGNSNIMFLANGSPELTSISPNVEGNLEKKRRGSRSSISRKSISLEQVVVPETVFGLSENPFCSFHGHLDDVLDLSWSKSQHLLSSSMDKTVRLWHLFSNTCLKIFSHRDYVTCIQFNPVDDGYFISGSLDGKVRIWSILEHQVVDWYDLHEMVTAACYTPDGQAAIVGSYKGSCHLYNISDNKLQQKSQINLQNKKKKSHLKKITGFQFAPGSFSEVLITSTDSRIRVVDGADMVHKFKGFRNTNSQISSSLTANGKYVISASEDSNVYIWTKHETTSRPNRTKTISVTRTYEHFHCQDVSVAIPWPGPPTPAEGNIVNSLSPYSPHHKLILANNNRSPRVSIDFNDGVAHSRSAWGMVIVTAGLGGKICVFQNFGLPVRI